MKKSLIALAAVAASGFAMAQSSVTLFGVVDTSVAYADGADSWTGMQNGGLATSRLGFRGTEDLGGGLKANFWLEGALSPDNGGSALDFKRRSTIGLEGNFGEVRFGRELTAAYSAVSRYDVFGDVGFGATRMFSDTAFGTYTEVAPDEYAFNSSQNVRRSNMVTYLSPNFSGFRANLNYAFGESAEDSSGDTFKKGAYYGAGLTYDNGPLSLGFGVERQNNPSLGNGSDMPAGDTRLTAYALGGSYDFGAAKLTAAYRLQKNKPVVGETLDAKGYMIGVAAPVGAAGVVKASYNRYDVEYVAGAKASKADHFSIGYVHNLSKRTAAYGTYSYIKNKKNNVADIGLNGASIEGYKQGAVQVGVRHAF